MAKDFLSDVDFKAGLLLNSSAGTSGQFLQSAGPGQEPVWGNGVTLGSSVTDVLDISGSQISADDPGADRLIFWDDSAGKLTHLSLGANLSITGTEIAAAATQVEALLYFDSSEFIPANNPPGVDVQNTTTHVVFRDFLVFDPGTVERAIRWFVWPSGWNTAKATIFWYTGAASGSVVWQVDMRVYTDGDAMDSAWGTPQSVTDAVGTANTHRQTSATPAITPAGTVSAGKHFALRLSRDATNAADTLASDAYLMGVLLERAS